MTKNKIFFKNTLTKVSIVSHVYFYKFTFAKLKINMGNDGHFGQLKIFSKKAFMMGWNMLRSKISLGKFIENQLVK
jgi:hypothetical protein